jgi:hypothetical protein
MEQTKCKLYAKYMTIVIRTDAGLSRNNGKYSIADACIMYLKIRVGWIVPQEVQSDSAELAGT